MTDKFEEIPPTSVSVRALLAGAVADGTVVVLQGQLFAVSLNRTDRGAQWAHGGLDDGTGEIEMLTFPRAFSRSGRSCFEAGVQVVVTGRVAVSEERTLVVADGVSLRL